jgi:hypothetical protein
MGIWKTTDCGSTWVHINTGPSSENCGTSGKSCAALLDTGRNWTFEVDRNNPQVLYTNSGYGSEDDGLFKSTNGGVDWVGIWPSKDPALRAATSSFVMRVRPDLDDHLHLLLSFHEMCGDFKTGVGCLADSTDGGSTWRVVYGTPPFGYEASGFILSSKTWITTSNDQLWRTSDSGASWASVSSISAGGHVPGQLYRADDGVFYLGAGAGVARSEDGIHWVIAPNTGGNVMGVVGSGKNLYASGSALCYELGTDVKPYRTSPESDGLTWTTMPSPPMTQGGNLAYDRGHHLLYASNCRQGFWRVVTP